MRELLGIATVAAQKSANAILELYGHTTTTIKKDASPVTEADIRANDIIYAHLKETNIPILSEETLDIPPPYPELLWVIDPLDGTVGFINGTDDFSVMIALLKNGTPVLGIVAAPALQKLYIALKDEGAFLTDKNGSRQLQVSTRTLPDLIAIQSKNHAKPYMTDVAETLKAASTVRIGSVGIKAGAIAEGQGDFYLSMGAFGEWDVCAPELILREAGGTVTDRFGESLMYGNPEYRIANGIACSNTLCHEELLEAIRKSNGSTH